MISRLGFDLDCAKAAKQAMQTDDPTFIDRCRTVEFHGLYDPEPCGAVLFVGNVVHVASLRACGLTVQKLVNQALNTRDILFAPIHITNTRVQRLAERLGFKVGITEADHHLYWRTKS